ncbi:hypothetical protein Ssi03_46940 [Sphaerisporangium siamense]|nr:hypothetical protein Ssi03_46940 [Sphaerisporangium siamense]
MGCTRRAGRAAGLLREGKTQGTTRENGARPARRGSGHMLDPFFLARRSFAILAPGIPTPVVHTFSHMFV